MRIFVIVPAILAAGLVAARASADEDRQAVVFPLAAVNVEPALVEAIGVTVATELENQGYTAVDYLESAARLESAVSEALAAAPPPPPPAPAAAKPAKGAQAAKAKTAAPAREPPPPPPAPPKPMDVLAAEKTALLSELGCTRFVEGLVVKLGDQFQIHLKLSVVGRSLSASKKMVAATENDLPAVLARQVAGLVQAVEGHAVQPAVAPPPPPPPPPAPAAGSPLVPVEVVPLPPEPEKLPLRNFGVAIGQGFGISDNMRWFTTINFDGRFEWRTFLVVLNAGLNLGSEDFPKGTHFNVDITLAAYLASGMVAPFLGAGGGLVIGRQLYDEALCDDGDDGISSNDCSDSPLVEWNLFPVFGIEFLRAKTMRLHLDVRYVFGLAEDLWGHGVQALVGINF